jgi:hypothetical protein
VGPGSARRYAALGRDDNRGCGALGTVGILVRYTGREAAMIKNPGTRSHVREWLLFLLFVPLLVLYVPLYNTIEPTLFGFPFFYWFQLAWILASMIITAVVYYGTEPRQE